MPEASFEQVRCGRCGLEFDERAEVDEKQRTPCRICGSTIRSYAVELTAGVKILTTLKATGLRAGLSRTKGWFIRTFSGQVPQRNRNNAIAQLERTFDRDGDRYIEKVTMCDSGEVIHSTNEPLSEHKGHGSDKPKK